jgi:hypothetical protein
MRLLAGVLAGLLITLPVLGEVAGSWSSQLSLSGGEWTFSQTLTLRVSLAGWEWVSRWDPLSPGTSFHTLSFHGQLGNLRYQAGASFSLFPSGLERGPSPLVLEGTGLEWQSGFLDLELALGGLTLRVSLVVEPPPPQR